MKRYENLIHITILLQTAMILVILFAFHVDDMTLSRGKVSHFDEGWVMVREDGSRQALAELPYTGNCAPEEKITVENVIPKEYFGKTMYFLSADKRLRVTIDGREVYSFGLDEQRLFGHTPGSVMAFVDIPADTREGIIHIESSSPYANYAANVCAIKVASRDVAILRMIKEKGFSFFCSILILAAGVVLFVLDLVQKMTHKNRMGMGYLAMYFLLMGIYHIIETKVLTVFYGNQTLYSNLVFIILMTGPLLMEMYFAKSQPQFRKRFCNMMWLSFANIVVQLVLQLSNLVDFMSMAFASHAILFLLIFMIEVSNFQIAKKTKGKNVQIQFAAVFFMGLGGGIDIIRTYIEKVGDLGKYSRYGVCIFAICMVGIHVWSMVKEYVAEQEEHAGLLEREMEMVEQQNRQLLEAKNRAEQAKQEADRANEAKSTFLANMSHEIRTPINGVLGMDEMILRESGDKKIQEYALNIQSAGRNLLSIINDILDFSKIESGKLEILPVEYELSSLLNDCYNMAYMRAKEKNLTLRIKNAPDIPAHLYGDEVRVRQIINNLLTNAVKYTKEGGVLLQVDWVEQNEKQILLKIAVEDTGVGISKEDQKKLFQSFQRVDEKNNRNIEGTGLGLTIVQRLLDLMEGSITVESEAGKGSCFTVELPQKAVDRQPLGEFFIQYQNSIPKEQRERESFEAPEGRILVVDDVPMNLKVFTGLLAYTKLQIDTADSGMQALQYIQKQKYHIIFMDHMMPEMDGVETFQKMREMTDCPNADTPVVILTANALVGAKAEYLKEGFSDYLSKPVKDIELEQMILRYLPEELVSRRQVNFMQEAEDDHGEESKQGKLSSLDFLDTALGLSYCMGDEEFYFQILADYIGNRKDISLQEAYDNEDWEQYRIQVHALKSTSLTIGAKALSEQAKSLEQAAKDGDIAYIRSKHDGMMREYQELRNRLEQII